MLLEGRNRAREEIQRPLQVGGLKCGNKPVMSACPAQPKDRCSMYMVENNAKYEARATCHNNRRLGRAQQARCVYITRILLP